MFLSTRIVVPEILDTLEAGDSEAVRSRRDLRRLDFFLGGSRWIVRSARSYDKAVASGIVELGAGEGRLCNALCRQGRGSPVLGLDFSEPTQPLDPGVTWRKGDFFQTLPQAAGGMAVGSLILHHFERDALEKLGKELSRFQVLIFSEPLRHLFPLGLSCLAFPFIGKVTRHDMPASIRAGFRRGELATLLGLDLERWKVMETTRPTGILRFKAWRD